MALTPGTSIGPYDIVAPLGAGGMGEVFRARDTRLRRDVAIKVLPASFANHAERLARFTREAQTLASLNHPNIAHIHGLEESNGVRALVMELVEGEDLSRRLARGAIPVEEVLPIAKQIAEALEAAHEQGIIHRDLKPANIKLGSNGRVKVLDFGLAKLTDAARPTSGSEDLGQLPTMTSPAIATGAGMLLGTAAYMSPEQVRGQAVDKRADIWAFGCVLYEMLAGRRAFGGHTVSDTLAEVIKSDPDWSALPAETPPFMARLLRRCLNKDRRARLADIADARFDLEDSSALVNIAERTEAVPSSRRRLRTWHLAAAILLSLVSGVGVGLTRRISTPEPETFPLRVSIVLPADVTVGGGPTLVSPARILALSPDGRQLAFTAGGRDGHVRIWIRTLESNTARPLAGTEGAQFPFWSPDSRFVAFYVPGSPGTLRKVDVSGRAPETICEARANLAGGTWNRNDVIVFSLNGGPLMRVSAEGGQAAPTTVLDTAAGETRHFAPFFLPDGDHFLYLSVGSRAAGTETASGLYVGSLSSAERKLLQPVGSNAQYTQGLLVFLEGQTLMAQPFSPERLELTGTSTVVAEGVRTGGPALVRGAFTVSANGVLAYLSGVVNTNTDMVWLDRQGNQIAAIGESRNYQDVALAPNGRRAAMTIPDALTGNLDIWLHDTAAPGAQTRFTFDPATDRSPVWSPDGSKIAFTSERTVPRSVYLKSASGSGAEEPLVAVAGTPVNPHTWSTDGSTLLLGGGSPANFWRFPMSGDRQATPWLPAPFSKGSAQFSPDGRWVAYSSSESGRSEIWVASFTQPGGKWQVSTDGGEFPRWRRDGRELFFLARNTGDLMAVPVNNTTVAPEFGKPQRLFLPRARTYTGGYQYDVAADGQRFLVSRAVEEVATSPINVVLNWTKALRE